MPKEIFPPNILIGTNIQLVKRNREKDWDSLDLPTGILLVFYRAAYQLDFVISFVGAGFIGFDALIFGIVSLITSITCADLITSNLPFLKTQAI